MWVIDTHAPHFLARHVSRRVSAHSLPLSSTHHHHSQKNVIAHVSSRNRCLLPPRVPPVAYKYKPLPCVSSFKRRHCSPDLERNRSERASKRSSLVDSCSSYCYHYYFYYLGKIFKNKGQNCKMASADLQLPPGFRFHPTDEELVMHYLCRKCASQQIAVPIIAEIDLYKYDPWDLPGLALYGEKEWYFFSPRDRKYPNGSRPNRSAGTGYWKATGADKPIGHPKPVGIKKALVFYAGKAPKGEKSNWIMHEYRLADVDRSARKKNSLRLDDWVLCRIYNKKGAIEKQPSPRDVSQITAESSEIEDKKPVHLTRGVALPPPPPPAQASPAVTDYMYFDNSDSIPKLHTDSSCSEQVVSPEFASEVQSEPKWNEWEKNLDFPYNYIDATLGNNGFGSQFQGGGQMSPLQDMFMYMQKPF